MEYSVNELAKISGVTTRALRYYDQIGLLRPRREKSNGYRTYGEKEVDLLQQILFYRELGVRLEDVRTILFSPDYDRNKALEEHLAELLEKRNRIDVLIKNVGKTIESVKGEIEMSDVEKFEGFKQKMIEENEQKYGQEIREKYGDEEINASNAKVRGMTKEQYDRSVMLSEKMEELLKKAVAEGNPGGESAQMACKLHKEWLMVFYPNYSAEYHKGIGEMYVADERFKAYYDKIIPGCAEFLRDAINIFCG